MPAARWLISALTGLLLAGCASLNTAPTVEARQALAPTGPLRVGLQLGSPHNVIRDATTGEMKGVGFDLGKELAARMGVAFVPVLYPSVGALLDAGKSGAWDVAFVGFSPARANEWDFTGLHLQIEFGYLVPAGSSISDVADVDRAGVRVAVQEKSQPDVFISRTLKNATLVRGATLAATLDLVASGNADAIFSIKPSLYEASSRLPGSRVLDGRLGVDPHAMVMPKGRNAGAAYAREFIEQAKSGGYVQAAIERVGMRGAIVAPPQSSAASPQRDAQHDFDFEFGTWKTHLKRLLRPLTGSTTWVEYHGTTVVREVWGGRANLVELVADGPAGHFEGLSLRLYDPQSRQWSLNFSGLGSGSMSPPAIGHFSDGRGEFFNSETLDGRAIQVRFVISDITANSCRFEQSFSADGGKTWEVNWIAVDTRT